MSCYNSTVPDSPPQMVTVTSVNPASLMVSWQPPPMIHHNGPITYVINYTRVGSSDMNSVNVNSGTMQSISGLIAFVEYSVTVAARTVNGTGPFSNPEVQGSGEDSELNIRSVYSYTENHLCNSKNRFNILLWWAYSSLRVHDWLNLGNVGQPRMWLSEVPDQASAPAFCFMIL